ncbi:MAG: hypothetical protein IIY21_26960 [Clostridiales bacterium]|nr:hypothetical protein [Clostridiales bacterium]
MKVVVDIPEVPKNDKQRWALANGTPYVERPHGEWIDVPKYKGFYVCSKCLERLGGDFERFDNWEMKKENFCSVCGSDNRKKEGEAE